MNKSVSKHISTIVDFSKLTYKILRATKQIEFTVVTSDTSGHVKHGNKHSVNLTDAELTYLIEGGKIYVAYACGYEVHVTI